MGFFFGFFFNSWWLWGYAKGYISYIALGIGHIISGIIHYSVQLMLKSLSIYICTHRKSSVQIFFFASISYSYFCFILSTPFQSSENYHPSLIIVILSFWIPQNWKLEKNEFLILLQTPMVISHNLFPLFFP